MCIRKLIKVNISIYYYIDIEALLLPADNNQVADVGIGNVLLLSPESNKIKAEPIWLTHSLPSLNYMKPFPLSLIKGYIS